MALGRVAVIACWLHGCGPARPDVATAHQGSSSAPIDDKQEFQLYRAGAIMYPTTSDGLKPGARLPVYDIVCTHDTTQRPPRRSCAASTDPLENPHLRRFPRCFSFDRQQPTRAVLDGALNKLDTALKNPSTMNGTIDLPMPDGGVTLVRAREITMVQEVRSGGCEGGPDPEIGTCDPEVVPTGRTIRSVREHLLMARPPGRFEHDAFQWRSIEVMWAQPGHRTHVVQGNVTYPTFHPDPRLPHAPTNNGLMPDARAALQAIAAFSGTTTPTLDVALLANAAIAWLELHDQVKLREALGTLERALAARPPVDAQRIFLDKTLAGLRAAAAGDVTFVDPCPP